MHHREIAHASADYTAACQLREAVLRAPLGRVLRPEDVADEEAQLHFVTHDDAGHVVGCVLFKPLSATHIKLRQMAVSPTLHGGGVGRALVTFAEAALRAKGYRSIETSAREVAIGFYEKLGYRREGPIYEEIAGPHTKMTKEL